MCIWALMQYDGCPCTRRDLDTETDAHREGNMKRREGQVQAEAGWTCAATQLGALGLQQQGEAGRALPYGLQGAHGLPAPGFPTCSIQISVLSHPLPLFKSSRYDTSPI